MRGLQLQFFVSYAIFGCLGPLYPVYLREVKGFTDFQVGINQALASIAAVLAPVFVTLLADLRIDARKILTGCFMAAFTVYALIPMSDSVLGTLTLYMCHSLAFIPAVALQDGYYFSLSKQSGNGGLGYHRVRVWGTIGFIVPSMALYFLLEWRPDLVMILWCAMLFAFLSVLQVWRLPRVEQPASSGGGRLPSAEALGALLGPKGRWFCLAMVLAFAASTAYHTFFPVYLREIVGVKASHVGLIINVGVILEIGYILALGRLRERFGIRRLMLAGLFVMVMRLALIASFPSVWTATLTQITHGLEICAIFVLPIMYLNQLAGDRFRNSIQGVYTMIVIGGSRIGGSLFAGHLAERDLLLMFYGAASVALVAFLIIGFLFRPEEEKSPSELPVETAGSEQDL